MANSNVELPKMRIKYIKSKFSEYVFNCIIKTEKMHKRNGIPPTRPRKRLIILKAKSFSQLIHNRGPAANFNQFFEGLSPCSLSRQSTNTGVRHDDVELQSGNLLGKSSLQKPRKKLKFETLLQTNWTVQFFFWPPHRSIIHERLQLFDPAHADALRRKYGKRKKNVWTHMVTIWSRWPFVPIVLTSYGGHRAHLMGKSWNKCKNDNINSFWKHGYEKNTTSQFDVTGLDVWFAFTWFTGSISDMRFCCSFCWCEWQQNMTCQTANMLPLVQLFIQLVCIYMFSQHDVFISTKSAAASHVFFNNMFMSWLFFLHSSITLGNSLFLQHLFW